MTREQLDGLKALVEKATPGPWSVADYKTMNTGDHVIRSPELGRDDPTPVVASVVKRKGYSANAAAIVALHNAAPSLIAIAEAAMEYGEAVRSWESQDEGNLATRHQRLVAAGQRLLGVVGRQGGEGGK